MLLNLSHALFVLFALLLDTFAYAFFEMKIAGATHHDRHRPPF